MNAEVIIVFGEILQHMKDNNATLTAQNKLMRKQNETQKETTKKLIGLMEDLEDHDDVQNVYSNFDIPDEIMAEME